MPSSLSRTTTFTQMTNGWSPEMPKCCIKDTTSSGARNVRVFTMTPARMRKLTRRMMLCRPADGINALRTDGKPTLNEEQRKAKTKRDNASRRPPHQRQVLLEISWLLGLTYTQVSARVRHRGFYRTLCYFHTDILAAQEKQALAGLRGPL